MNLRRLSVFVKVVDEGSFVAAARKLGVPRSAVSQAISALESELGARLLHRSSHAVSVTEAGETLYRRAAQPLRTLEEASLEVSDHQGPLRGMIRMTAPVEVGSRLLEPVLSQFLIQNPGVNLELTLTSQVLDLNEHRIDLAVRGGPVRDQSLVARQLGASTQTAGLFAAPDYLARHGQPRRITDLSGQASVVVRATRGTGTWKLQGPSGLRTVKVPARVSVDSWGYALRATLSGVGIALLPTFLCAAHLERGELARVLPAWGLAEAKLWLVYASARYLPRPVAALRDALLKGFSSQGRDA